MRLARRASLLVAFSLLTSAATAYAECAWVLWESTENLMDREKQWTIPEAFERKGQCDHALEKLLSSRLEDGKKSGSSVRRFDNSFSYGTADKVGVIGKLICLPNGTDPRVRQ